MDRRSFIKVLAMAPLAGVVQAGPGDAPGRSTTHRVPENVVVIQYDKGHVDISGPPESVRLVAEKYQGNVWEGWKTHDSRIAKDYLRIFLDHCKNGTVRFIRSGKADDECLNRAVCDAIRSGIPVFEAYA